MKFGYYQKQALKTAHFMKDHNNPNIADLMYAALEATGEAGEITDELLAAFDLFLTVLKTLGSASKTAETVKKIYRDTGGLISEQGRADLALEVGDLLYAVAMISHIIDVPLDDIARLNIEKLHARHKINDEN